MPALGAAILSTDVRFLEDESSCSSKGSSKIFRVTATLRT